MGQQVNSNVMAMGPWKSLLHTQLFWNRYSLAEVAFCEDRFDDANVHIEIAKSHAVNFAYLLGCVMHLQACTLYRQRRIEEAKSETLCAIDLLEGLGASQALEGCRALLRQIDLTAASPEPDDEDGLLQTVRVPTRVSY
jgi:hypothetical protein